ncbi:hemerythrin [Treponema primitia ZAS-2]|uniref:Hemerythrin n=1 Tax=Treponema primitia (strain ATCC BAA-887 / DSM 12427 / ZAS-2) TaxID=545694 RepID=F5YQ39_TREPZ|nr:hemerythrin family protein [Treponema primitia]AEF84096.1 hemerythrin [Treponema primitia ZAS-2]
MAYTWDLSLATGQELIDEQHQQLFAAINDLLRVSGQGKTEEIKKSLDFLNNYTIKHFFDEEQIQKKYNYPDYENHKKLHEHFKATIRDLSHQLILNGVTPELTDRLCKTAGDWLVGHIKGQDLKLAAHIKATDKK